MKLEKASLDKYIKTMKRYFREEDKLVKEGLLEIAIKISQEMDIFTGRHSFLSSLIDTMCFSSGRTLSYQDIYNVLEVLGYEIVEI